ncbi:MAG: 50S ribosomal protein L23 [Nanoarchaeota archaeon]
MRLLSTEKAVMKIETENTLTFELDKRKSKDEIKKEIQEMFNIKIDSIRTLIRGNKKYAYAKLNSKNPAIDIATKLGLM